MARFQIFNCVMFFFIVCLLASAHLLNNFHIVNFLECQDKNHWKSNYITGRLFSTFHVILILMGTVQAERAFYSIPHKLGYFESNKIQLKQSIDLRDKLKEGEISDLLRNS